MPSESVSGQRYWDAKRLTSAFILIAYSALLIKVVVFKDIEIKTPWLILKLGGDYVKGQANFVPFKTILLYLRGERGLFKSILNLGGNTVPFVPVGFLVPLVYRSMTWPKALALAVTVGLAMEGMEGLFRVGIVDIDDVILNAGGVAIGYRVFTLSAKWKKVVIGFGAVLILIAVIGLLTLAKQRRPMMHLPPGAPSATPASAPTP
jgi:glycopeptide antibiotics resistance protein